MVRKRSRKDRGASRGAVFVGLMAMLVGRIWGRLARRPVDSVAIIGAAAASLIIIINAVFLQSGSQRAPFVANPTAPRNWRKAVPMVQPQLQHKAMRCVRRSPSGPARR